MYDVLTIGPGSDADSWRGVSTTVFSLSRSLLLSLYSTVVTRQMASSECQNERAVHIHVPIDAMHNYSLSRLMKMSKQQKSQFSKRSKQIFKCAKFFKQE